MATLTPKQERLASVPLFASCSPDELRRIERVADELRLPAGRRIIGQDELGREFFVVESGTVEVLREGEPVARLGAGNHFGELALLGTLTRTADVVAVTDVELVVIGTREFSGLLAEVPQLAVTLLRAVATQLAEARRTAS